MSNKSFHWSHNGLLCDTFIQLIREYTGTGLSGTISFVIIIMIITMIMMRIIIITTTIIIIVLLLCFIIIVSNIKLI